MAPFKISFTSEGNKFCQCGRRSDVHTVIKAFGVFLLASAAIFITNYITNFTFNFLICQTWIKIIFPETEKMAQWLILAASLELRV